MDVESTITDAQCDDVATKALIRLKACRNFELQRICCEARSGVLFIRGQVSTYYLKQLAQEALRFLSPEHRIVNQLEVAKAPIENSEDNSTWGDLK